MVSVLLLATLGPCARATVCNFEDLPTLATGSAGVVPNGYCGINWFGETSFALYFSNSFRDTSGTASAHSQPNATFDSSSNTYSFAFVAPSVFNGLWATPDSNNAIMNGVYTLRIQYILSLKGTVVFTSPFTTLPFPGGAFVPSGYGGAVDTVVINSREDLAVGQESAGGFFSIDDVTYSVACGNPTISPNTDQNVPATGGSRSLTVTATQGCPWSVSSTVPWITITSGSSGTGTGSPQTVNYSVESNSGPARKGSLTVGGQTLNVIESGSPSFMASDTVSGLTASSPGVLGPIKLGEPLNYSGLGWPQDGGPIQIFWGNSLIDTVSPPNFQQTTPYVPKLFGDGKSCLTTLTAIQGSMSAPIAVGGTPGAVIRLALSGATDGLSLIFGNNTANFKTGDAICPGDQREGAFMLVPHFLGELCLKGTCPPDGVLVVQYNSGLIDVVDTESNVFTWGFPLTTSQTLVVGTDIGPVSIAGLYNGSPADVSSFDPAAQNAQFTTLGNSTASLSLSGSNRSAGDLTVQGNLEFDGGVLFVAGNLTVNGDVTGVGSLAVTGNVTIGGRFTLQPTSNFNLITSGSRISLLGQTAGQTNPCATVNAIRTAFGTALGSPGFNPAADLNGDGVIDVRDLAIAARSLSAGTVCQ